MNSKQLLLVTFLITVSALLPGVGVLGEVLKITEYTGMVCIFLGLMIIDGRVLGWLQSKYKDHGNKIPTTDVC